MKEVIKLKFNQRRKLRKLIKAMNELLGIENASKIKSTIKALDLNHSHKGSIEFDYGKNLIRIYSMNSEWRTYREDDEIYFDLNLDKLGDFTITSNCKTSKKYLPKIVITRLEMGLKYLADNSKEFVRKINLIVDEDGRNVALLEFLPRRYVKL